MRLRSVLLAILLTAGLSFTAFSAFASSFAYNGSAVTFYQQYERDSTNFSMRYEGKLVRLHTYVDMYQAGTEDESDSTSGGQLTLAMLVTRGDVRVERCYNERLNAGNGDTASCGQGINDAQNHFDPAIDRQFCSLTAAAEASLRRTGHFHPGFYTIQGRFHNDDPGVYIHDCSIVGKG